jgi:hypothetical protein
MTNRAIKFWALMLALPLQYAWLLGNLVIQLVSEGVVHHAGAGYFGCSNFHEPGLWSCTFFEMLLNPLFAMYFINFLSFGIAFAVTALVIGVVLLAWRRFWYGHWSTEDHTLKAQKKSAST